MTCVWEIRMKEMHTITLDFADVMLGVNGVNELNIIDGEGIFGGSYARQMVGVDIRDGIHKIKAITKET
jgi:hypothetical protein